MTANASYRLAQPSDAAVLAAGTAVRGMDKWRDVLKPLLDGAVEDMKADGFLPMSVVDALEDFGKYCQLKGREIRTERVRLGLQTPPEPKG